MAVSARHAGVVTGVIRGEHRGQTMNKLLLATITALLMRAPAAHAVEEPFSILNPKGIAKGEHADDWLCGLNVKMIGDPKLDAHAVCVDKDGKVTLDDDGDLVFSPKPEKCTKDSRITGVKRTDRNAYLVYMRCDYKPKSVLMQLLGDTLLITNTENY
jgi:hypothetical protein